jgi:hypothetical protein
MTISLALALLAIVSGTLTTYLYDERASFAARLCSGACTGIVALGLIGFVIASFLGLTPLAIGLTAAVLSCPVLLIVDWKRRLVIEADLRSVSAGAARLINHPDRTTVGYVVFYLAVGIIFWRIFNRAVIDEPDGLFTGLLNNFGDLPFHISVITSFAFGNNFPPQDPTFAGVTFTYPFITDFVSAVFVRCGANLRQSMLIENYILAIAFVGLIHRWAWVMLRDRLAAIITPLIVLLNGGLGWVLLWDQWMISNEGLVGVFKNLLPSFTVIPETTWRWGNAVSALLVPQRGMLLGLPLAVIVFTQWWLATDDGGSDEAIPESQKQGKSAAEKKRKKKQTAALQQTEHLLFSSSRIPLSFRRMAAAGVIAGTLPLVHAHSFVAVMAVGFFIGLLQRKWAAWAVFIAVASAVALPQMWWSTHHSAVDATKFFEWQFGWDRGQEGAVWFWFKNTGLFIPLIALAVLWRGKEYLVPRRLLLFYLPFTLCFIVPNVLKMAPWIWDNIKILFYWWLASAPLVALLLARLWKLGFLQRVIAVVLFICITFAGALDVAGIAFRSVKYEIFDARGISFAEVIKEKTEPQAVIMHAPVHNHPVFLTGRRSLMGYPGHIWTHGLEFTQREGEIRRIYSGAPDAYDLIRKLGIQYAVIGPHERNVVAVNEQFFSGFEKIGEVGEYRLYKISR